MEDILYLVRFMRDVVEKIATQETDKNDAPVANPVKIQKIEFQRYR